MKNPPEFIVILDHPHHERGAASGRLHQAAGQFCAIEGAVFFRRSHRARMPKMGVYVNYLRFDVIIM
jgi:hypothetical protein